MAQAENGGAGTSFCNWLHHTSANSLTSFLFSLLLPTTLLLLAHSCHGSKDDHFYLDLPSREGYACAEVSSFVNEFDPFYRWSIRSSLPSILSRTAGMDIELANHVYQQASAWRVMSNWTGDEKSDAKKLYASADPHIGGGHMNHNWLWRMRVDWGISVRMCLLNGFTSSNRSCLWTTPIISMENEPDLSQLLVSLPYRAPTAVNVKPDLENMKRSTTGYYLTNYASNARTDFTKYQKLDTGSSDSSHYYVTSTKQIKKCEFAPSYYSNDAMAYLGFSGLQCGCSNSSSKVCVVVTDNMNTGSWGSFDYQSSSCSSLKSYWAWNGGGLYWLVLVAHNTSSDKAIPFVAMFTSTRFTSLVSSVTVDALRIMENTTVCVEKLMQQSPVPSDEEVQKKCSNSQLKLSTKEADFYLNKTQEVIWTPTPPRNNINSSCLDDLGPGQLEFKDKLCVTKLDPAISGEIKVMIESMKQLRDVKFKQNKLWEDGSNSRHQAYSAILSAFVSFVGTCLLVTSHKLQDFEDSVVKYIRKGRACFCGGADSRSAGNSSHANGHGPEKSEQPVDLMWVIIWFICRLILVALFGALLAYTAYSSLESVKKDRDMLQAQTVPQVLSDGTVVLLTTTATYEVTVSLAIVYVVSALTLLAAIWTLVVAWGKLTKVKRADMEASKEGQNGNVTN